MSCYLDPLDENPSTTDDICAYCAKHVLTGAEDPEHAVPRAINGRFTTRAVCDGDAGCNAWAGTEIDQVWLDEPFVGHLRFTERIPDRRGRLLKRDPLLRGETADGRRIELDEDGRPILLNSVVETDLENGEIHITAPDQETMDRLIDRELRKLGKTREDVDLGESEVIEDRPEVFNRVGIYPPRWERLAAKMTLALLAETMPSSWRTGESASRLRERMKDMKRDKDDVHMPLATAFQPFAPAPCTSVLVSSRFGGPAAIAAPMGLFMIRLELGGDLPEGDRIWVSDPHDPKRSFAGGLGEVVGRRQGLLKD